MISIGQEVSLGRTFGYEWQKIPGKMTEWNGEVTDTRQVRAQKYSNASTANQWGHVDRWKSIDYLERKRFTFLPDTTSEGELSIRATQHRSHEPRGDWALQMWLVHIQIPCKCRMLTGFRRLKRKKILNISLMIFILMICWWYDIF